MHLSLSVSWVGPSQPGLSPSMLFSHLPPGFSAWLPHFLSLLLLFFFYALVLLEPSPSSCLRTNARKLKFESLCV